MRMENNIILAVDDEVPVLELYRSLLSDRKVSGVGIELLTVGSGEEAVELVRNEIRNDRRIVGGFFDINLADGMDGIETARRIRSLDQCVICVFVTGYRDRPLDDFEEFFGRGHEDEWDYISKPFTKEEIIQKARNVVASWNRRRELEKKLDENLRLCEKISYLNDNLKEMVKKRTRELERKNQALAAKNIELENLLHEVQRKEAQLVHSERFASMGRIAAGIAREMNNPMGYVHSNLATLEKYISKLLAFLDDVSEMTGTGEGEKESLQAFKGKLQSLMKRHKIGIIKEDLSALFAETAEESSRIQNLVRDWNYCSKTGERKGVSSI